METVAKRRSALSGTQARRQKRSSLWRRQLPKRRLQHQLQLKLLRSLSSSHFKFNNFNNFLPSPSSTRPCFHWSCWRGLRRRRAQIWSWRSDGRRLGWSREEIGRVILMIPQSRRSSSPSTTPSTSSPTNNWKPGWWDTSSNIDYLWKVLKYNLIKKFTLYL